MTITMANLDTGVRKRLTDLLQTVLNDNIEKKKNKPADDGLLPEGFLKDNNIRLVQHDFEKVDSETGSESPLLFKPRPLSFLTDECPIDSDHIKDEAYKKRLQKYPVYGQPPSEDSLRFTSECSGYLFEWAYGGSFRIIPDNWPAVGSFIGIAPVR